MENTSPEPSSGPRARLRRLIADPGWKRHVALWAGAVAVALVAIVFAKASDAAFGLFARATAVSPWWALAITPAMFALLSWATTGRLRSARGSGIPQVIASLERPEPGYREAQLSLRVSAGKLVLTVLALLGGASVGREGPTVHVGAGIMHTLGRRLGFGDEYQASRFLLAGGAAGIAAAFNAPLAGVVFAIEELSGTYQHRFSGALLTAVIIGGVVSLGILGDYAYFGHVTARLPLGQGWLAVALCGVVCGLLGGLFARTVVAAMDGRPRWLGRLRGRSPILFAAACGVLLALLGIGAGPGTFGTGYEQARELLQGGAVEAVGHDYGVVKFAANLLSYLAGIPGGLFSPALAVGAGVGHNLSVLLPAVDPRAMVLLGMTAYLAGVTQAPLTSAVIAIELTDNHALLLPILAVVLVARGASALVCKVPIYKALAQRLVPTAETPHPPAAAEPAPVPPRT
ncbi:chloride channel protein [Coralloluteibacterium stylophorae]|uniref:Chloride channel protein n=1 Tax=Coralloluteibacterium stylophorae TaxID=1776034 RepID=A0A8J7VTF9_9GAMM|nr:chloride channel protein [Coralloluteibacterium stylophorae]MBS7457955.1 chloride channel protein [Coralloluteibacterium stylophorae]